MRRNSVEGINRFQLGATIDPRVIQELDKMRGYAPRSRIIEDALVSYLKNHHNNSNSRRTNDDEAEAQKGVRGLVHQAEPPTTTSTFKTSPSVSGTTRSSPSTATTTGASSTASGSAFRS